VDEKVVDKELVAYCGLYCGDCFGYRQKIPDLAGDLKKELDECNFKRNADFFAQIPFFKPFRHYNEFYKLLGFLENLRCDKACRGGGGPPFCEIRKCCQENDMEGCWECHEFENCKKLDFLRAVHDDAYIRNLKIIKNKGVDEFIKGETYW